MKTLLNAGIKNSRLHYFVRHMVLLALPPQVFRNSWQRVRRQADAACLKEAEHRADYYNRLTEPFTLDPDATPMQFKLRGKQRNYQLDLYEFTRCYNAAFRLHYLFGDVYGLPSRPTLVKARPLAGDNRNAVLFNLNKIRHFVFVDDPIPFAKKRNQVMWRGHAFQENRKRFLEQYFNHAAFDVGHAHKRKRIERWQKPYLNIRKQLDYKFILSLEGNDVASNLKWIMSSNSLCMMPKPRNETWFMEGTLIPGVHYVEIKDDFSDLEAQMDHYASHEKDALQIIREANAYVGRFQYPLLEQLTAHLVLRRYFALSGQLVEA